MPTSVSAAAQSILPTTNHVDVAFITLTFPNNVIANIHVSWLDPQKIRNVSFVGSKARLSMDDTNNSEPLRIFYKSVVGKLPSDSDGTQRDFTFRDGDIISPLVENREPLTQQVNDFLDCILHNKEPLSGAEMGIKITKILVAIDKSIKLGQSVQIV